MNVAIYINRDGTFECDVTGGKGTKCRDVTDQIFAYLGKAEVEDVIAKPEMHEMAYADQGA